MTEPAKTYESETHYKELRAYFESLVKYTLTALGIILAVGAYFFYRNISEVRSEAALAIEQESRRVSAQIDSIRTHAAIIAITEATRRVDDAFKARNVVTMVETAAKRQTESAIERQVATEVDHYMADLQADLTSLGDLADNGMRMRIGLRSGLDQLYKMQTSASNDKQRERARSLFQSISADYESVNKELLGPRDLKDPKFARSFAELPDTISSSKLNGKLVQMIRSDPNLSQVAIAFLLLQESTGVRFPMFDFQRVERWCSDHQANCIK